MRKGLFILLLILAAGCSKIPHSKDNIVPLDAYIFFDAEVKKTKGNLIEGVQLPVDEGTAFGVLGLKGENTAVFDTYIAGENGNSRFSNVAKMYRPSDEGEFTYDELALWTTEQHSFYAYYPYDAECIDNVALGEEGKPYICYTQPTKLEEMKDILTASVTNMSYSTNTLVELAFDHRLFAFDVVINNTLEDEVVVTGASITFTDLAKTADLNFDGSITTSTETLTFTTEFGEHTVPAASSTEGETKPYEYSLNNGNSFLFLPCSSLKVDFELKFLNALGKEITFKNTESLTLTPKSEKFEAGKKYALVLTRKKSGNIVTFTPSVEWESINITHTFN